MSKNIVICLDGTWNKPDQPDAEVSRETNVRTLYEIGVNDGASQVMYYDSGVGTHWYDRKIGGSTGIGLSRNVRQAYQFLSGTYEQGDKVFLFGFSRGAYTARSLGGFIYVCGLIRRDLDSSSRIRALYEVYKRGNAARKEATKRANIACPIEVIGVFDTVGALGIPVTLLAINDLTSRIAQFHDTKLSPEVKAAYHAVAIDEQREVFEPTLWDTGNRRPGQIIEQVWFAGAHSDVGGGYAERGNSDVALKWMLAAARRHGFKLKEPLGYAFRDDPAEDIHDSCKLLYRIFGDRVSRRAPSTALVHRSVQIKMARCPRYGPAALVDLRDRATLTPYTIVDMPRDLMDGASVSAGSLGER